MSNDSVGWNDPIDSVDLTLNGVPTDWSGWTRAAKVQRLVDVVQNEILKVRAGTFAPANGEKVAALALEAQMELAQFYADAESSAKNAKHLVEYAEGETAAKYQKEAAAADIKVTEASLKRMALPFFMLRMISFSPLVSSTPSSLSSSSMLMAFTPATRTFL